MGAYNYDNFSADDYDFENSNGPQVGEKAYDFELMDASGNPKDLLDFEGDFLVLELGSITCPLFQARRKTMMTLQDEFPQISNFILYVREAHPGQDIPMHKDLDDKLNCAQLLRDDDGEKRTIIVDDIEGSAHKAYGSMPNAVFIINKHGCVVFRAGWNNGEATRAALHSLIKGEPIRTKSYFKPATPSVLMKTLKRAGAGSRTDFFKSLPYLFWQNIIKRNLRLLFNSSKMIDGDMRC